MPHLKTYLFRLKHIGLFPPHGLLVWLNPDRRSWIRSHSTPWTFDSGARGSIFWGMLNLGIMWHDNRLWTRTLWGKEISSHSSVHHINCSLLMHLQMIMSPSSVHLVLLHKQPQMLLRKLSKYFMDICIFHLLSAKLTFYMWYLAQCNLKFCSKTANTIPGSKKSQSCNFWEIWMPRIVTLTCQGGFTAQDKTMWWHIWELCGGHGFIVKKDSS